MSIFDRFFTKPSNSKNILICSRRLQIESLESRELLSVNPILPFQSEQIATVQEAPLQVEEAETTTLTGLTLNVTAANYAELNALYDFANITSISNNCVITADGVTLDFSNCTTLSDTSLTVKNGGVIKFPKVTAFSTTDVVDRLHDKVYTWDVTGNGRQLDFSALTTLDIYDTTNSYYWLAVTASTGGKVNLTQLRWVDYAKVTSKNAGSVVYLSDMISISGSMNTTTDDGGVVIIGKDYNSTPGASVNASPKVIPAGSPSALLETPDKSNGVRAAFNSETGETTLEWANLGTEYSYYIFKNGTLVTPQGQLETTYTDSTPPTTTKYVVYSYNNLTGDWTKSLPAVLTTAPVKAEIVSHEATPEGGIKLNWNIPQSSQFVVFRNGIPVSGNVGVQTWTDAAPLSSTLGNQYVLYVNYLDDEGNSFWTWSSTYVVQKPVAAAPSLDAFWAEYDLTAVDDDVLTNIV